jgi:hypothetical protein
MSSLADALGLRAVTLLVLGWTAAAMAGAGPAKPAADIGPYEHVTITVDSLAPSFASLKSLLLENMSLHDTVILTDSIYAHEVGRDNPEKIRNFIRYAYQNWQTSYVLLGGDVEHVPTRKTYVGLRPSDPWYDTIACDQYYSCLDGTWDADSNSVFGEMHDSVDLAPEVYVGRAPVSTIAEADRFVRKILAYSRGGTPRREVFLAGFDLDSAAHGEQALEYYDSACIVSPFTCAKVYDSHGGNHRDSVLYYLNQGFHYCIYDEHGCEFGIGAGFFNHNYNIYTADIKGLANGFDKLTVFISAACLIGAFDCYTFADDCFTEYYINDTAGGGVAAMTNSRFGYYTQYENPPVSRSFAFIGRFVDRIFSDGRDTASAGEFTLGKADLIGQSAEDTVYRWSMYTLNLLGEPALKMTSRDGIEGPGADTHARTSGLAVRPAIFSRFTTVEYGVGSTRNVTLGVYDAGGRCVRTIAGGRMTPGRHAATWNGRTELGCEAPAGVYVIALKTEAGVSMRKVVLCSGKEPK